MTKPTVVITDLDYPDEAIERAVLEPLANVRRYACRTEAEVSAAASGADALLVQWAPVSANVIAGLSNCKLISRYGIGFDMIDVAEATRRGIPVSNVPDYCIEEVATHTIALLLSLSRRIIPLVDSVRAGQWNAAAAAQPLKNLGGQTLGLLSFGRIARLVARRAVALGLRVITCDPYLTPEAVASEGVELVRFEELLSRADYLSLHTPLTGATHHIIDRAALKMMQPTAYLINTARGPLIDSQALSESLKAGELAGAALDVLDQEPPTPDHPLLHLPNVLVTPHAAWYSEAALPALRRGAAEEVARALRGEPLHAVVNPAALGRILA